MVLIKKHYLYFMLLLLVGASNISCGNKQELTPDREEPVEQPEPETKVLKEKASFNIGAAIKTSLMNENGYTQTVTTHFSQITAEWEMKMDAIWTSSSNYQWTGADKLVDFATKNDLDVHGHTLVWYKSFPSWFKNTSYDSTAFENHVKTYIKTVVDRYKGKVNSWDVANEIFNDNGSLRMTDCPVYATFKDPIAFYGRCFRYAHEADPNAKLFYNDYSVVIAPGKRNAIKNMVQRFQSEGIPIHGIGDQFHYRINNDKTTLRNGLNDMASTGLLVHISELDIVMNVNKSDNYVYTEAEAEKQSEMYKHIAESYSALPAQQKFAISLWGVTDKHTWLTGSWHPKEYPLLFDQSYRSKEAYKGFLSGLK
ncbi:endo-1,4-beta-xylanase [Sphingobacterium arenae]|uniref:Beta-xylanase n=1 Tax=Sphingobacterium arenae TaxID=1280598 RepID=A0ABR7Y4F6_9SPHI|nr:endo-1,4-beta-xylanase [Sphingobacterium arenae]MBD1426199.1 endo-1,4-beta-xylanase [Sphingobacterium arenae]